jgi:hypothetical protein
VFGSLTANNTIWYADRAGLSTSYASVIWNRAFVGDFILIASWNHNYIGAGFVFGPNVSTDDFTGYSSDSNGPYFGGTTTSGFPNGYSGSYFGQYHAPISGSGNSNVNYWFKWQRRVNTLTLQYSTAGPNSGWTNFNTNTTTTCSTGDKVICGIGEASDSEGAPLTFISVQGR